MITGITTITEFLILYLYKSFFFMKTKAWICNTDQKGKRTTNESHFAVNQEHAIREWIKRNLFLIFIYLLQHALSVTKHWQYLWADKSTCRFSNLSKWMMQKYNHNLTNIKLIPRIHTIPRCMRSRAVFILPTMRETWEKMENYVDIIWLFFVCVVRERTEENEGGFIKMTE